MKPEELCLGCFQALQEGETACSSCGYDGAPNPAHCLPLRTRLADRYLVGRALPPLGDSLLYMGYDEIQHSPIVIREFFPDTLCRRATDGSVQVEEGCGNAFAETRDLFRQYMRAVARMRELPVLVAPYDIFETNHTIYTIAEYVEGPTVESRLKQVGGRLSWERARPLFMPVLSMMITLHAAGIHHLGISTDELLIGRDGKLHLQGFCIGDARCAGADIPPRLASGYAAPEQYVAGATVGASADVYALAAVIFRTVTGNPPPEGNQRVKDSNDLFVPSEVAAQIPDHVAAALFRALQVNPEERTPSLERFRDQLTVDPTVAAMRADAEAAPRGRRTEPAFRPKRERGRMTVLVPIAVFVFLLLLAGAVLLMMFPEWFGSSPAEPETPSSATTVATATPTTVPTLPAVVAPKLMGQNYFDIRDSKLPDNLRLVLSGMRFSEEEKGTVLSQTPAAGMGVDDGGIIEVIISAGPETVTVPDVRGWKQEQAKLYLEALGFRVDVVRVMSASYDYDTVEEVEKMGDALPMGTRLQLRVSDTVQPTKKSTR